MVPWDDKELPGKEHKRTLLGDRKFLYHDRGQLYSTSLSPDLKAKIYA